MNEMTRLLNALQEITDEQTGYLATRAERDALISERLDLLGAKVERLLGRGRTWAPLPERLAPVIDIKTRKVVSA